MGFINNSVKIKKIYLTYKMNKLAKEPSISLKKFTDLVV